MKKLIVVFMMIRFSLSVSVEPTCTDGKDKSNLISAQQFQKQF